MVYGTNDGSTPDPDVDTPLTEVAISGGFAHLDYTTVMGDGLEGAPLKVIVTAAYESGGADIQSEDRTVHEVTLEHWGPDCVSGDLSQAGKIAYADAAATAPTSDVVIDAGNSIFWRPSRGGMELWADTVLIWKLVFDVDGVLSELRTPFAFVFDDFSAVATGSDGVEVGTWTVGTKELFFTQGGNRVLKVDVVNERVADAFCVCI